MQVQKPGSFMNIMESASLFGMPKLLACCEYNILIKPAKTSRRELMARCDSEPLLARSSAHIAEGYRKQVHGLLEIADHRSVTMHTLRRLFPNPRQLLEMAAADSTPR